MTPPRSRAPRHTAGNRICKLCWHATPPAQDMFIVIGMGPDPMLVCGRCADKVLELRPDGQPKAPAETPGITQLTVFDQIKES